MLTKQLKRKPYRRSDYLYLLDNYRHHSASQLAKQLGRTTGSLYRFISQHPELRKQGKN
jgi:hypothetical protein